MAKRELLNEIEKKESLLTLPLHSASRGGRLRMSGKAPPSFSSFPDPQPQPKEPPPSTPESTRTTNDKPPPAKRPRARDFLDELGAEIGIKQEEGRNRKKDDRRSRDGEESNRRRKDKGKDKERHRDDNKESRRSKRDDEARGERRESSRHSKGERHERKRDKGKEREVDSRSESHSKVSRPKFEG